MEAAVDWLRKKGLAKAAKKAGRVAAEGLIGVAAGTVPGALVEVNSETDFVARNDEFQELRQSSAPTSRLEGRRRCRKAARRHYHGAAPAVDDVLKELVAKIGENMTRAPRHRAGGQSPAWSRPMSTTPPAPELGKIGVLVALESTADRAKLARSAKQIAMHVAAANPLALIDADRLPKDVVERERAISADQAASIRQARSGHREDDGGPACANSTRNRAAAAGLRASTARRQVAKVVEKASKDFGAPVEIDGFVRFAVGEGIEKADSDFADEVAAQRAVGRELNASSRMRGSRCMSRLHETRCRDPQISPRSAEGLRRGADGRAGLRHRCRDRRPHRRRCRSRPCRCRRRRSAW